MLISACLMKDRERAVEFMRRTDGDAGENFLKDMDSSTECISLSTNSLDGLPPEMLVHLRKAMEIQLEGFGQLLLAAMHYGIGSQKLVEAGLIVQDGLDVIKEKLRETTRDG